MSDNYLFIFPQDVNHMPAQSVQDVARRRAKEIFAHADEIEVKRSELPELVSAHSNFMTVRCPNCREEILEWWPAAMERWRNDGRVEFRVIPPCCGKETRLDRLDYDWPQGFARFVIAIRNPGRDPRPEDLQVMAEALGTSVRVVRAHL